MGSGSYGPKSAGREAGVGVGGWPGDRREAGSLGILPPARACRAGFRFFPGLSCGSASEDSLLTQAPDRAADISKGDPLAN